MKIGLVLEGGAMRGLYTAGVLDMFLENKIEVDTIVGVSAGVLFGVNYMSNQKGRAIRYNKKYIKDKRYMGIMSLLTTGNIINKDFAFYDVPLKLDKFDEEAFENSDCEFYATVTNVETGKPEYFKINNIYKEMELLRATSAMPFVSKIVDWKGKKYLDGGIADSIPLDKCKELGCDRIIVILTRTNDYRKRKPNSAISNIAYRKYPNLANAINSRYINYNSMLDKIIGLEKKKDIYVIRPSKDLHIKRIEKDEQKLQDIYDLGIKDCMDNMIGLQNYLDNK